MSSFGNRGVTVVLAVWVSIAWLGVAPNLAARPNDGVDAVTDQMTYNVGERVSLRIISSSVPDSEILDRVQFTLRYAGDANPVAEHLRLRDEQPGGYWLLWTVPAEARAGRYEISGDVLDRNSGQVVQQLPQICSFVVHRQVVQIDSIEIRQRDDSHRSYYTAGDSIGCRIQLRNLGDHQLSGLRLEFSERYWPWIVQQKQKVGSNIVTLQADITLNAHSEFQAASSHCTQAPNVKKPTIEQYAAVIWDHERKNVYGIGISPMVFINPPGVTAPRPYGAQFMYPDLAAVNTTSYRHFHPEPFGADAIQFETDHTQFRSGTEATIRYSVLNPTDTAWRQVNVSTELLDADGKSVSPEPQIKPIKVAAHGPALKQDVTFQLPNTGGVYRVRVRLILAAGGQVLASNEMELGVNPLPQSVLMFCAHEDDDGTQMGFIRALVENDIPFHLVYYTSGDAGSCDRYYEHSCGPAEALNFGSVRMQEARAAMKHLGVPPENIYFLGLPDGGTGKIWYDHINSNDPYLAVLLATDHAPYDGVFRPNLPYARDAVVDATEEIIKRFQPEVVFTNHPPAEGHIDHIVNNYFTVKALQELLHAGAISTNLEVRVDGIFDPKEYPSTPYHYEDRKFYLSSEVMSRAQEAGWFYESQGGNRGEGNLKTWNKLPRTEAYRIVLDWKEHEGWNEKQ